MLALHGPRNLTNGAAIDTAEALSSYNKKQFHHIFPKAHLKGVGTDQEPNTPANICILAASENNAISDEDPHAYLPRLIAKHGDEASAVFRSNLLPNPLEVDYSAISYVEFLELRSKMIHEKMVRLANGEIV